MIMGNTIIGMMFTHDEGDILEEILEACLNKVDSWFISNDNPTDNSWDILNDYQCRYPDKIEYLRNTREDPRDQGQRQALLSEIQRRYKPQDTWVQVLEADTMLLDTDVREAIRDFAVLDIGVTWTMLHAVRKSGTWESLDTYPIWEKSITEVLPYAQEYETMLYTFRPLPKLAYNLNTWRPWPQGFSHCLDGQGLKTEEISPEVPLLAHYGYRGPQHVYDKYKGTKHPWNTSSVKKVEETFWYFNGVWNGDVFPMSREGWRSRFDN